MRLVSLPSQVPYTEMLIPLTGANDLQITGVEQNLVTQRLALRAFSIACFLFQVEVLVGAGLRLGGQFWLLVLKFALNPRSEELLIRLPFWK